jgi:hypothetical protein
MRPLKIVSCVMLTVSAAVIASCSPHSENFKRLSRMEERQRVQFAASLPTQERLKLYEEFFESSHPPDTGLSSAFRSDAWRAFPLILSKMRGAGQGEALSYLPIIADLQASGAINICEPRNISMIKEVLAGKGYDSRQKDAIGAWKIGRCRVSF